MNTHRPQQPTQKTVDYRSPQNCERCGAPMPEFFWGENGGASICQSCGFKHPCCDT